MTFTVTYREKSGAKAELEIVAASRAECIAECKRKGFAPMSIREGHKSRVLKDRASDQLSTAGKQFPERLGVTNANGTSSGAKRKRLTFGLALFVAIIVIAVLAYWLATHPKANPSPTKPPVVAKQKAGNDPKAIHVPKGRKDLKETPPAARPPVATTNKSVMTNKSVIVPQQAITNATAKTEEPKGGIQYRTCTEQILGWIFSCPVGNAPMPLPNLPPKELEHLEEILATPNLPKDTDDDFVKEQKAIIQQAKIEFRKFLDEGGKPRDFLNYYHDLLINYHDQFMDAQKSVLKAVREEDPEFAREYLLKVNAQLAEKGIKPIMLSRKFSERIGIEYKGKEMK